MTVGCAVAPSARSAVVAGVGAVVPEDVGVSVAGGAGVAGVSEVQPNARAVDVTRIAAEAAALLASLDASDLTTGPPNH